LQNPKDRESQFEANTDAVKERFKATIPIGRSYFSTLRRISAPG
jgi:hypothetical protein